MLIDLSEESLFNCYMQTIEYQPPFMFKGLDGKPMMMKETEVVRWTPLDREMTPELDNQLYEYAN